MNPLSFRSVCDAFLKLVTVNAAAATFVTRLAVKVAARFAETRA